MEIGTVCLTMSASSLSRSIDTRRFGSGPFRGTLPPSRRARKGVRASFGSSPLTGEAVESRRDLAAAE